MTGAYYTSTFRNIVKKYNKSHVDNLPNISITRNLYAPASLDGVKDEMVSLIA